MNVWILFNRDAGRSISDETVRRLVAQAGHTVVDLVSARNKPAFLPDGVELVVAAGGDGTVASAVEMVEGTAIPLAILPVGTANNIAASLGLRDDMRELISSWNTARRLPFDLGYAKAASKRWRVVEGVGGGFVPAGIAAAEHVLGSFDEEPPPSTAVAAAVRLFHRVLEQIEPVRRTLTIDGKVLSDEFLMFEVLNIRSVGPNLVLAPDAIPSDGYFDVVVAGPAHRPHLLEYFESRVQGRDRRLTLPTYRARVIEIDACEELHIDDQRVEICEAGAITVEVSHAAIDMLV